MGKEITEFVCIVGEVQEEDENRALIFKEPYFKEEFWSFLPSKLMKAFKKGDKIKIRINKEVIK